MVRPMVFLRNIILFVLILMAGAPVEGAALGVLQREGVSICFPPGEEDIAARLADKTPGILLFLKSRGLPVKTPLHVILDVDLDQPEVIADMIPHREIRIPLRAPGVLEEGYLEGDPWMYFYFKGLCLQGIYSLRAGLPAAAHHVLGEAASPNVILPPWLTDGVCRILYSSWSGAPLTDPYNDALFRTALPGDISQVSNHPGTWPGYFAGRVFGIPFMSWVHSRYGWEKLREFLVSHGGGIMPIEIELKAEKVFGRSWTDLWTDFVRQRPSPGREASALPIDGYWPEPFVYWNAAGTHPGRKGMEVRSRYGCLDGEGTLWLSGYTDLGVSRIVGYGKGIVMDQGEPHLWDPSPGGVGVTRKGSKPFLVFFDLSARRPLASLRIRKTIPAPPGVIQLSGPALGPEGSVAVAAHSKRGWDIWVYDQAWKRVTTGPGIEMDPWWEGPRLVFVSDATGTFQVHDAGMAPVTNAPLGAMLPRNGAFLSLTPSGWVVERLTALPAAHPCLEPGADDLDERVNAGPLPVVKAYSPFKSLLPDFIAPDLYAGPSDLQAGLVTWGRDVSGDYSVRGGVRYSFSLDYVSLQASTQAKGVGLSFSRYPLSYDPENQTATEESRSEVGVSFRPPWAPWAVLAVNRQHYGPLEDQGASGEDFWGEASLRDELGPMRPDLTVEVHSGGLRSVFGGLSFAYGSDVVFRSTVQAGKSWGETSPGHGTFRVGGNTGEGYFTRRPSRLFPLRGFDPNVLEADKAVITSNELFLPLADLQRGHRTLPLFLHRLSLGAFADAGVCSDRITRRELMAGVGLELLTSMEVAWGNFSMFKLGIAWPAVQPQGMDEKGPILVFQLGRPL